MNKKMMMDIVKKQLALDMNCLVSDFDGDETRYCEARLNEGRRLFDRQEPFLEVVTMGKSVVVSADKAIIDYIKPALQSKSRDDIFNAPFLYGQSIYYIPDPKKLKRYKSHRKFDFIEKRNAEIHELYKLSGFENALMYNPNHPRPDVIALCALHNDVIVAIAGASADSEAMWQIGIDVLPKYRNLGLATALVSDLAIKIIEEGRVPYYGTASSNIASQAVAFKSGFIPTWMCSYKNVFDGTTPYEGEYQKHVIINK
ncbi:GNAT family N-acetyltransferase [Acidaminobacter sp. JC074]|uniref:GNAT family N-acetyltransferase n=1 Tax=Acidaminobacter sp. JC074 TaxID=2530199 RepID=UPI001F0F92B8|nr:GNAT family N-acetyltransferase [Acidaminobacter sp. JC074]